MAVTEISMQSFNLKLLQTFVQVAELRSFRRAAELTNRSQSAVSTQVKQLETQLGIVLLRRTTRDVTLTREGEELLHGARRAVQEVSLSLRTIQESIALGRGRVSIASAPTVAAGRLPFILAQFQKDYPEVRIDISEVPSERLFETVRQGEVDFAVGQFDHDAHDMDFEPIFDDVLMALMPQPFGPPDGGSITLAELSRLSLMLLGKVTAIRQLFERTMRDRGLAFEIKHECLNALTLIAMAEAGLGVAVLPQSVLRLTRAPSTTALRIVDPPMSRQIAILTLRGRQLSPAAARLAQLVREQFRRDQAEMDMEND